MTIRRYGATPPDAHATVTGVHDTNAGRHLASHAEGDQMSLWDECGPDGDVDGDEGEGSDR